MTRWLSINAQEDSVPWRSFTLCDVTQETYHSPTYSIHVSHHFCPSSRSPWASRFSFCGLHVKSFRQRQTQYLCPRAVKGFGMKNKPVEFNNNAFLAICISHWHWCSFIVHKNLFAKLITMHKIKNNSFCSLLNKYYLYMFKIKVIDINK